MGVPAGSGLDLAGFQDVDAAADPRVLVGYLDQAKGQPALRAMRARMIEQLRLVPGARVLDAGCGPGIEAVELAEGFGVEVVGVDASQVMVDEAAGRVAGSEVPVSFHRADATRIPFPDASFDASQAQTLLGHVPDPGAVVAELARLTRPGGRVVALDLDQGSMVLDHPDRAVTRLVLQALTDDFACGWTGRQLRRQLRRHGLDEVTVELSTMEIPPGFVLPLLIPTVRRIERDGTLAAATLDRWWEQLAELVAGDQYTAAITWFLAAGTVPTPQ